MDKKYLWFIAGIVAGAIVAPRLGIKIPGA